MKTTRGYKGFFQRGTSQAAIYMGLSMCLSLAACDEQAELDTPEPASFRTLPTSNFARRVSDMARIADLAYNEGDDGSGIVFEKAGAQLVYEHRARYSTPKAQVWEATGADGTVSIIVAFRGTQASPNKPIRLVSLFEDLWADMVGSFGTKTNPTVPWNPGLGIQGNVGEGFDGRVREFMTEQQLQLLEHLDDLDEAGTRFEMHVVGHSLGAISSQLFSVYAERYMRVFSVEHEIYNFSFNAPRGVDAEFSKSVVDAIHGSRGCGGSSPPKFASFILTVKGDPVSTAHPPGNDWWSGLFDEQQPNSLDTNYDGRGSGGSTKTLDIGYCPRGELPASWNPLTLFGHEMTEGSFDAWASPGSTTWPSAVAECMSRGYSPLVLGDWTMKVD